MLSAEVALLGLGQLACISLAFAVRFECLLQDCSSFLVALPSLAGSAIALGNRLLNCCQMTMLLFTLVLALADDALGGTLGSAFWFPEYLFAY